MESQPIRIKEFPRALSAFVFSVVHVRSRVSLQRVFALESRRTILKIAHEIALIAVNSHVIPKFRLRCERRRTLVTKMCFKVYVPHYVVSHVEFLESFVATEIALDFRDLQVDSVVVSLVAHRRKPTTADLTHFFVPTDIGSRFTGKIRFFLEFP